MGKRPRRKATYTILQILSAPNVVARNETGRLPLKLNILLRIIKFWIHLESLPENSITKQCSIISNQSAHEAKTSFMLTVNEIIHNYKYLHHQSYNKTIQTNNIPTIKNDLQKIKCHISNNLKRHQLELIRLKGNYVSTRYLKQM